MSRMNHLRTWAVLALATTTATLSVLASLPDTFKISEPANADPYGSGWSVDPRLGQLSVTIPIGTMPGEISFPVSLLVTATPTTQSKRAPVGKELFGKNDMERPVFDVATYTTPISCMLNLPSIRLVPGGTRYVLEDGRSYSSSDFKDVHKKHKDIASNIHELFDAYGVKSPDYLFLDDPDEPLVMALAGSTMKLYEKNGNTLVLVDGAMSSAGSAITSYKGYKDGVRGDISADGKLVGLRLSTRFDFGKKHGERISKYIPKVNVIPTCTHQAQVKPGSFLSESGLFVGSPEPSGDEYVPGREGAVGSLAMMVWSGYVLLMDNDRMRVFAAFSFGREGETKCHNVDGDQECTSVPGEKGEIFFPIYMADRFGHYVTIDWSASKSRNDIRRVEVLNQRKQGFVVRMRKSGTSDIARLDFVNVSAPSALIEGGRPSTYWLYQGTADKEYSLGRYTTMFGPESIGVPTRVTIGTPDNVRELSWSGDKGDASDAPSSIPSIPPNGHVANRTWSLAYDKDSASLKTLVNPLGLKSEFDTKCYQIYQTANESETRGAVCDVNGTIPRDAALNVTGEPCLITGVDKVEQSDSGGAVRKVTWERDAHSPAPSKKSVFIMGQDAPQQRTSSIRTIQKECWGGQSPDRMAVYDYGDRDNKESQANNPTDVGNGFLNRWTLVQTSTSDTWALLQRKSNTHRRTVTDSGGGGLNGTMSIADDVTQWRRGELGINRHLDFVDGSGSLQVKRVTTAVQPGNGWVKVQETENKHINSWGMLEPDLVETTRTARFGAALLPPGFYVTRNDWRSDLLLQATYQEATGGLKHGTRYQYDGVGRVIKEQVLHAEGGDEVRPPNWTMLDYDGSCGRPSLWTTSYLDGEPPPQIFKRLDDFDSAQRPNRAVDDRGVITRTTYDLYGRPRRITREGEAELLIDYPDERTKITTRLGLVPGENVITSEKTDAFGRVIETRRADGTVVVPRYDKHNRVESITETNKTGAVRTSTTSYDLLDRVTRQTSFTGKTVTYTYTTEGMANKVIQTVDPDGLRLVTETLTDPFGQTIRVKAPNGDTTTYEYDGWGNKTRVVIIPASGGTSQERTFAYDALGRLIRKTEPETGTQLFSNFNPLNQAQTLTEVGIDPNKGSRTRFLVYDGLGRLRSQSSGDTSETFTYGGAFLTSTTRTVGGKTVTQTFSYAKPGAKLGRETTTLVEPTVPSATPPPFPDLMVRP